MAYYARIADSAVVAVHVIADAEAPDEKAGAAFLAQLYGTDPNEWVQTFTDGTRGQQASPGDLWRPDKRRKDGGTFEAPPLPIPPEVTPGE